MDDSLAFSVKLLGELRFATGICVIPNHTSTSPQLDQDLFDTLEILERSDTSRLVIERNPKSGMNYIQSAIALHTEICLISERCSGMNSVL